MVPFEIVPDPVPMSLMLAVITSSDAPLVLLDGDLRVIAVSSSFCRAFQVDFTTAPGTSILNLGDGEWNRPQLASLLTATGAGFAKVDSYEMDLVRPGADVRHLLLNAHKLSYDHSSIRIMLAISDVTEARAAAALKDDLVREKEVLLREVQHRVANSLQIIASLLMQSARHVLSEEMRGHLESAHGRVMSIAAVQRQLASTGSHRVHLQIYLTQLCMSLGASMIYDRSQLQINVNVDESVVDSDRSISLGLIVTELVINALKHGFPNAGRGAITVEYQSQGEDWALSVSDNGVGMTTYPAKQTGLGTSIIEALARQLSAGIDVTDGKPGTVVRISHFHSPTGRGPRSEADLAV